ncbi:class II aldolase/adducin family protein [Serratia ficaria]|uniref:Aldolase II superfamily protein n=1 Tax=Serratia ficaria TaxID=61651 RepID=A0A240ALR8_SERFI|nr:class II aldolase/adducin family protein [Serratia ficaria]REF42011.1 ribulose-5-phosphate 4-epimerase/fuculose-1-phosphate aldolase [Serratia ficaria]CAI0941312.1 aldolase II superfamily protein [Serratia ficaria]CAI0957264.1 aldolase II superfamily protein [Serratia ficaria]CAI1039661.1 aldolase II superfamily protein [Serratia ficaria]CAI2063596.1 aldolase II superfamily protein [Serratia ficaria]
MTLREKVSSPEWQARCELAALYRLIAHFKMTDMIDTHISLHVPGKFNHFLINKYGVLFEKMTASELVKIDFDGNIVEEYEKNKKVNAAGFVIHSAIHQAREDIRCIIHTHTSDGMAVSAQKQGLLPLTQHALKFYGNIGYHTYEGIALSLSERDRLVNDLGIHNAMILRNHGLLGAGKDIAWAFHEIYFLERACQAQVKALSGGGELVFPDEEVCRHAALQFKRDGIDTIINDGWEAAKTFIDDQKESYCS